VADPAKVTPVALCDDLLHHLTATLPPEVTEVLLPALRLQDVPGGIRAEARNPTWLEVWHDLAVPTAEDWLRRHPLRPTLQSIAREGSMATPGTDRRFESFIADPGNQLALAACHRVVEAPGIEHNPLYLHGGPGTGKSHLLAAIAGEFATMLGEGSVVHLDGPAFVTSHAVELARREASPLRSALASAACILLDGVDALAGRDLAQEELFHLLNDALDRGAQVVVSGRVPPGRLDPCSERLSSRLSWGLVIGVEPPQLETRIAMVLRRGGRAARAMTSTALASLVEARAPDMHQAVALADHLAQHGSSPAAGVTGFDRILATVAERCRLRPGDLTGKRRDPWGVDGPGPGPASGTTPHGSQPPGPGRDGRRSGPCHRPPRPADHRRADRPGSRDPSPLRRPVAGGGRVTPARQ
jgi:hypothetical protein